MITENIVKTDTAAYLRRIQDGRRQDAHVARK